MIENGTLVHGEIDSSLEAWMPESFFITGLLLAILATVLSFQSTSLAFDLFLGNKPTGESKAPDMHMLLLADEGSPLSVAAAVFRRDELDRARFYGDIPPTTAIVRNRARIKRWIAVKLFFILLTAPLINLIAVFLVLETDEDISFSAAGFGPVTFGYARTENLTLKHEPYGAKCFRIATDFSHAADENAQFFYCLDLFSTIDLDAPAEVSQVTFRALPSGQLQGVVQRIGVIQTTVASVAIDIASGDEAYRISQGFTQEDLQALADQFAAFTKESCESLVIEEITPSASIRDSDINRRNIPTASHLKMSQKPVAAGVSKVVRQDVPTASQVLECIQLDNPITGVGAAPVFLGFFIENEARVSLVETNTFRVVRIRDLPADGSEPPWFDGSTLLLLERRRHYVPLAILFIVVGVLLVLRLLVECIANNDVYDGIDEVVARNVGLSNSYSMIRSDRLIRYDHKYQRGLAAHYGTPRPGLPEVRQFAGGALGVGGPEDPYSQDAAKFYGEEIMNPTQLDD